MPRSSNAATPLASVVAVTCPSSVPLPEASAGRHHRASYGLPPASVRTTTGWLAGSKTSALSAAPGGCVVMMRPGSPPDRAVAVKVTGDPSSPLTAAVVVCSPAVGPNTRVMDARPSALVREVSARDTSSALGGPVHRHVLNGVPVVVGHENHERVGEGLTRDPMLCVPIQHLDGFRLWGRLDALATAGEGAECQGCAESEGAELQKCGSWSPEPPGHPEAAKRVEVVHQTGVTRRYRAAAEPRTMPISCCARASYKTHTGAALHPCHEKPNPKLPQCQRVATSQRRAASLCPWTRSLGDRTEPVAPRCNLGRSL